MLSKRYSGFSWLTVCFEEITNLLKIDEQVKEHGQSTSGSLMKTIFYPHSAESFGGSSGRKQARREGREGRVIIILRQKFPERQYS